MEDHQLIERSIIKKYRKEIWNRFIGGVKDYALIEKGDKIAACISGGKDSFLMAKCLEELMKHSVIPFALEFVVMDPGYNPENRKKIEENAARLHLPVKIFQSNIFNVVAGIEQSPCYLCARMRRGHLYSYAQELGCNKIALGHHFDDVNETTLLSMFYGSEIKTMMPKVKSANFPGLELIRPLYQVREADIIAWARYNSLSFLQCACRFTENAAQKNQEGSSKRLFMKQLIRELRKDNPQVDVNIFTSVHNVNVDAVVNTVSKGKKRSFLEWYHQDDNVQDADI